MQPYIRYALGQPEPEPVKIQVREEGFDNGEDNEVEECIGSECAEEDLTIYEQFKALIFLAVLGVLAVLLILLCILSEVRERNKAAEQLRNANKKETEVAKEKQELNEEVAPKNKQGLPEEVATKEKKVLPEEEEKLEISEEDREIEKASEAIDIEKALK